MTEFGVRRGLRFYSRRTQLAVTLHFLAHWHTLRAVAEKFGYPHNSISCCCIHRGVAAIRKVSYLNRGTKVIRWPRTAAQLLRTSDSFRMQCHLPRCVGAIDGSVIPLRKPTSKQSGGDADAFWNYKGHPATI
jgi:hypothetical protein